MRQFQIVDGGAVRSRRLTPREYARLMGLGDDCKLPVNTIEGYDLMGDGVAVPVVRYLAEHIFEPILLGVLSDARDPMPMRGVVTSRDLAPTVRAR
jgi:DNA (cytosine-5)-methyltransferase 1